MKFSGLILALLLLASPAWGARKMTVAQLQDMLHSLKDSKKSDAEVAAHSSRLNSRKN